MVEHPGTITVSVPSRARVLVGLSPTSDAMLVPLSSALADGLRAQKAKETK